MAGPWDGALRPKQLTRRPCFRRSIYVTKDINEGDVFSKENIRILRPGDGAPPHLYQQLLGRTARQAYGSGTPLSLDQLL